MLAQHSDSIQTVGTDSIKHSIALLQDTITIIPPASLLDSLNSLPKNQPITPSSESKNDKQAFAPNPNKAVIYALIFPGLGQFYNRKYWKLPIVYGGFLGCAYSITWNSSMYDEYKHAYHDILDGDPNTDYWTKFLPYGKDPNTISSSEMANLTNAFKSKRDYYRRYRDLSYFITVGVYALCVLDAYVDAQLFDFDISPDLSMRVEPVLFNKTTYSSRSFGLQCSLSF